MGLLARMPLLVASLCTLLLLPSAQAQEATALLDFKRGLTNSAALDSWQDTASVCTFYGVTCNEAGSVTAL
jgi:hypothetical protein